MQPAGIQAPVRLDFDLVLQPLINVLAGDHYDRAYAEFGTLMAKPVWLREMRTVGFSTPRQTGRSHWALEQLQKDPDAVMVVVGTDLRKEHLRRIGEEYGNRIFTANQVAVHLANHGKETATPYFVGKTVIVDDFYFVSRRCDVYSWIALNWNPKTVIVALN